MKNIEKLFKRFHRVISKFIYSPRLKPVNSNLNLRRLGSRHGGWYVYDDPSLFNSLIISAGLGEDASFDIEFAKQFNATVIIVDPTPRSIIHYEEIIRHIGEIASTHYSENGSQPINSYGLDGLNSTQLILEPFALWKKAEKLKFYAPLNKEHVSHSLTNLYKNNDNNYIEVNTINLLDLVTKYGAISLIKLDIEGAEVEVVSKMIQDKIFPNQVLIEYDEINFPSIKSRDRVKSTHELLISNNYQLIHRDGSSNCLYCRR
jgi:FkbM family methyltransferase